MKPIDRNLLFGTRIVLYAARVNGFEIYPLGKLVAPDEGIKKEFALPPAPQNRHAQSN